MNNIKYQIKQLERNINEHKGLVKYQYVIAKAKIKHKISSPLAMGSAFLAGFLLVSPKKSHPVNAPSTHKPHQITSKTSLSNQMLYLVSEVSGLLTLIKYFKNYFHK